MKLRIWTNLKMLISNMTMAFSSSTLKEPNKTILVKNLVFFFRPCQIDFLFSVTRVHAKNQGALNLLIQKLAR